MLKENHFFINLKKCTFMMSHFVLLGYIVGAEGIHVDE